MNISNLLIYDVYSKYIEAIDKLLEILKVSGVLDPNTSEDWIKPLYNLIYKYSQND